MATLVSTGQITIVDTNDARPITCALVSNLGTQQIYGKDNDTVTFIPDWYTANSNTGIVLTAKAYVGTAGGSQDITPLLGNRKFVLSLGDAFPGVVTATTSSSFVNTSGGALTTPFTVTHDTNGSTIKIRGNLKDTVSVFTLFFEGDYTDIATGLVSHVIAQITLNTLKTGTNAVFVNTRGNNTIEQATGSVKEVIAMSADLVRSSGIDTTSLTYKWYVAMGATQVSTSLSGYATKYGLKTVASGVPSAAVAELGVNIPVAGAGNAHNTLVISESAVVDLDVIRVDVTDSVDGKTYSNTFTVFDISDPYEVRLLSSSGDKLQNGQGNTTITPEVYYGAIKVSVLTGWSFTWYFYDKNGKRAAFVDTAKIATAGGAAISANTIGASATINYGGTSYAFAAGQIVKAVKPNGDAFYYEVASSTTNQVTIRTPSTNTWLNYTNFPAPSATTDFVGGVLFGCSTSGTHVTSAGAGITVTGDEIDVKGNIVVEANRP